MSSLIAQGAALMMLLAPAPQKAPANAAKTPAAQTAKAPAAEKGDEAFRTGTKKTAEGTVARYDFDNDNVEGDTLSPTGTIVNERVHARFSSMITIRGSFLDQIVKLPRDI